MIWNDFCKIKFINFVKLKKSNSRENNQKHDNQQ